MRKIKSRRGIICCIILLLTNMSAKSQFSNFKFENYSTSDGVSSSTCLEAFQSRDGYLWFGTIDGLNRFDGYEFEVFHPVLSDPKSISGNRVNAITEDNLGNLWVGTKNGLNLHLKAKGYFRQIDFLNSRTTENSLRYEVHDLVFDSLSNVLWVASNYGVDKINVGLDSSYSKLSTQRYLESIDKEGVSSENEVESIALDAKSKLWVSTHSNDLYVYESKLDKFEKFSSRYVSSDAPDYLPNELLIDQEGKIWYGNNLADLSYLDQNKQRHRVQISDENIGIYDLYEDRERRIWISTSGVGIYVLSSQGNIIYHFQHEENNRFSLPNNRVSKVIQDDLGIYWITTYDDGIVKLDLGKAKFAHYFYKTGSPNGLSAKIAQSVFQDSKGRIWIGTGQGGLNLFDEASSSFKHFRYEANNLWKLSSDEIIHISESYDGDLWISTLDGGLNKFNPETGRCVQYKHDDQANSIGQNLVWVTIEDKEKRLWAGTQLNGMSMLDPKTGRFQHYKSLENDSLSLNGNFVYSMFIDSKNRLLIGTSLGLNWLDLNKVGKLQTQQLSFNEVKAPLLYKTHISFITEDALNNIWVGCDFGLFRLNSELEFVTSYSVLDGLPSNLITGIQQDDEGDIWITSRGGISKLDLDTQQIKTYNEDDGLQGVEFQTKSIDKLKDGRIIAGGINGFNIFDPKKISEDNYKLKPFLTTLKIHDTEIKYGDTIRNRVLLDKPLSSTEKVVLFHDESTISIEFIALYHKNPSAVNYAYKMNGIDQHYSYTNEKRVGKIYSNLKPGDYSFEVLASLDKNWETASRVEVNIEILPPIWKTWWAYSVYGLFAVLVLWGSLRYYLIYVDQAKNHQLDQMKLQFFINVSHEFRTPLTMILNPLEKILENFENAEVVKKSATTIQKSAFRLVNLVNQFLDARKMDLGKAPLNLIKADIVAFCKEIKVLFEGLTESKQITLHFETLFEGKDMIFDPDKMEKILVNLLSNAVKFTDQGGNITIRLSVESRKIKEQLLTGSVEEEYVNIEISDTGIGLKKEQLASVFNRFFNVDNTHTGTGIGLNFTKSLVEQHEGTISAQSEYHKGSIFTVSLPVMGKKAYKIFNSMTQEPSTEHSLTHDIVKSLEYDVSITSEPNISEKEEETPSKEVILIVEDNNELRNHLKSELSKIYRTKVAVNGKVGLEKARKFMPDLIISDVMMPLMDGFEMCRELKHNLETSHIPIIMLTARSLDEDRLTGYSQGADAYFAKPFSMKLLMTRVHNILDSREKLKTRFGGIASILPESEIATNTLDEEFLNKSTQAVLDNIGDSNFDFDTLSATVGISRSHFYKKIQALTGQNPSHFVRAIRLKYATELLKQNTFSIKEIAYKSGFNSGAYFSKCFREHFNCTPLQFVDTNND